MRVLRSASSSQIRPPCASTIRRKIDTPSPAPGRLRDGSGPPWKNGSKMRSRSAGRMPTPCRRPRPPRSCTSPSPQRGWSRPRRVADGALQEVDEHALALARAAPDRGVCGHDHDDRQAPGLRASAWTPCTACWTSSSNAKLSIVHSTSPASRRENSKTSSSRALNRSTWPRISSAQAAWSAQRRRDRQATTGAGEEPRSGDEPLPPRGSPEGALAAVPPCRRMG